MLFFVLMAGMCLAFANGANDNFKGVATLFGSRTTSYRGALAWATIATLVGSCAAVMLAGTLLKKFSGKGLISAELAGDPQYGAAVALGAGLTVLLATRIGMPVSTTHGLVGALVGAGWAAQSAINYEQLGKGFFVPLLVSPILAVGVTVVVYPLFRFVRRRSGINEQTCVCVTDGAPEVMPVGLGNVAAVAVAGPTLQIATAADCDASSDGPARGIVAGGTLDRMHFLSAGVVSFARGLNDTPKIAALLLLVPALGPLSALTLVGVVIAVGGLLSARRVAETMSQKITEMNHGQGFTANVVTGMIVIGASRLGMPVSTTHVSCGSLFGLGAVTGQARWRVIGTILAAWLTTLPVGAGLGAAAYWLIGSVA